MQYIYDANPYPTFVRHTLITYLLTTNYNFSSIFWTEYIETKKQSFVFKMNKDHQTRAMFREVITMRNKPCNCRLPFVAGPIITVDHSNVKKVVVLVYHASSGDLIGSDVHGCHCRAIIRKQNLPSSGNLIEIQSKSVNLKSLVIKVDQVAFLAH